jgi:hypothetical protein
MPVAFHNGVALDFIHRGNSFFSMELRKVEQGNHKVQPMGLGGYLVETSVVLTARRYTFP